MLHFKVYLINIKYIYTLYIYVGNPPFDQSNISTPYLYFYSSKTNFS